MANVYLASVYGTINTNFLASVRSGEIKSQYILNTTDFATVVAENGMLLVLDEYVGEVKLPSDVTGKCWLLNAEVKDYENKGSKYFCLTETDDFLPRMYKLHIGDKIEHNCVYWNSATWATSTLMIAAIDSTHVFAVPSTIGKMEIVDTLAGTENISFKVIASVTLPNGETGLQMVCTEATY